MASGPKEIPKVFGRWCIDRRWSDRCNVGENCCNFFESSGKLRVVRGVLRGEAGDAAGRLGVIIVEEQSPAVGSGREDAWVRIQHLKFMLVQAHLARDVSTKRARGMRERGSVEARMKFFGNCTATNDFTAFQDQRLETTSSEIECGDQGVVPSPHNKHSLSDGHGQFFSLLGATAGGLTSPAVTWSWVTATGSAAASVGGLGGRLAGFVLSDRDATAADFFHSFKMTWLAMRPGAPMMPPPGCVADPHMYRLSIGVR